MSGTSHRKRARQNEWSARAGHNRSRQRSGLSFSLSIPPRLLLEATDEPRNPVVDAVVVPPLSAFSFKIFRSCVKSADPDRPLTGMKEEEEEENEEEEEEEEEEEDEEEEEEEEVGTIGSCLSSFRDAVGERGAE